MVGRLRNIKLIKPSLVIYIQRERERENDKHGFRVPTHTFLHTTRVCNVRFPNVPSESKYELTEVPLKALQKPKFK